MKKRVKSAGRGLSIPEPIEELSQAECDYVEMSMAVANYILNFTKSVDFKQRDIAEKLRKTEPEISKWLSGFHNLTLNSIIKLQSASSIKLLNPAIFENKKVNNTTYEFNGVEIPETCK